jgi:hypothetical protein
VSLVVPFILFLVQDAQEFVHGLVSTPGIASLVGKTDVPEGRRAIIVSWHDVIT